MKPIEISDNLFCGRADFCDAAINNGCEELSCGECHRKWPTPEQYKKEYGEEYPNDGAVYYFYHGKWQVIKLSHAKTISEFSHKENSWLRCPIVCARTPFGKPGMDWRPE